ncbi:MAG: hypothetical protein HFG78_12095 [Hungatella sp.]|jgi:hypothetical protein|nr:hypothetical protein [Hungatella sp.]MCI9501367.1 hypothetical protein [Hungatella sp.]MCI9635317.1 hypothetical protein [Hungatella sp.]
MRVDQDMAMRVYSQPTQTSSASALSAAAEKQTSDVAASTERQPDVDRVEISKDAKDASKMSASERASLVQSLKDDLNSQMTRFTNMMVQNFQKQGINFSMANGDDFWKMMASGNFTVDEKTKADAQQAISEDGFWGVKQTSQRIFDFAAALAGDDVELMKKYQAAVEKGFGEAEKSWGGSLPSICGDTHTAVNKLFDDYYAQHK